MAALRDEEPQDRQEFSLVDAGGRRSGGWDTEALAVEEKMVMAAGMALALLVVGKRLHVVVCAKSVGVEVAWVRTRRSFSGSQVNFC
jgi:hypothetical protein